MTDNKNRSKAPGDVDWSRTESVEVEGQILGDGKEEDNPSKTLPIKVVITVLWLHITMPLF